MMKRLSNRRPVFWIACCFLLSFIAPTLLAQEVVFRPVAYPRALRNPLKGFTSGSEWQTLQHTYIRWNELEDDESDGIDRIIAILNQKWDGFEEKNIKAIPRVYLHWEKEDQYFWPSDMSAGDYTSPQFEKRLLRLIKRLGQCWNNDPRVAFVELGIFGKWGEQHSPSPTPRMQTIAADAFREAFPDKLVSVRHPWSEFQSQPFGAYWDSWAHIQQMWPHGNEIAKLNQNGRWKHAYIGGEVAYNWGDYKTQPGSSPTDSVVDPIHRNHVINSIRWLHCTQLKWIAKYDPDAPGANAGAEEVQKALGYRFVIEEASFSVADAQLDVSLMVRNEGSAPFYYAWPLEISLLDPDTKEPVWKQIFTNVDLRSWLPGDQWTPPIWNTSDDWPGVTGTWEAKTPQWKIPPKTIPVNQTFSLPAMTGSYALAIAILDPANGEPAVRFANTNHWVGGRHPLGIIDLDDRKAKPLAIDTPFDDPYDDHSLHYGQP
ncbi:hypothetical protein V7x_09970 [Crateriforma conspicua]|uniref:DUF4832 domain-containing protein n=1 Tax=Crateriforma conspicua TaxID=2527996 RepID=A0A5C6FVF9_9PLAN|nr:DUF4832 domain-containing protein [Crateriforma conspicua]TWU65450.1 hypothetical protein V7x_09970 [Crateriforma conspicua]